MLHQRVLSRLDAGHVRFHGSTKFHAIVRRSLRKPGYVGTRNQCLGRSAAVVDAGAAKFPALDDAHPPPSRSETLGKGGARLPSAYDDRVVAVHVFLLAARLNGALPPCLPDLARNRGQQLMPHGVDRKSTRLNSSHSQISYAVFCLKKKKKQSIYDARRINTPY